MGIFVSVIKKTLQTKIQVPEKLNKIDYCFYQIVWFVVKKINVHKKSIKQLF